MPLRINAVLPAIALASALAPALPAMQQQDQTPPGPTKQDAPSASEISRRASELAAAIGKLQQELEPGEELSRKSQELAQRALDGIDLAALDGAAFRAVAQIYRYAGPARESEYGAALDARATRPTAAGFEAAVQRAFDSGDRSVATIGALFDHPGFKDGFTGLSARSFLMILDKADASAVQPYAARIWGLRTSFTADAKQDTFSSALTWVRVMLLAAPKDQADTARRQVLEICRARLATADDRAKKSLNRTIANLEGAAMRGELLGHPAPDLDIRWTARADGAPVGWTTLAELKGKVVVLDFWATWCGPCVGSFPKIAELRSAYPTDKVEIIGVTSLQGYVAHRKRPRAECKDDAKKEEAETLEFMKDMGVTWTVAISGKDVFNPDFAINGIPFVAILDQQGRVHKVGIHPSNDGEVRSAIDGLLGGK